jgi:hypothetical protein
MKTVSITAVTALLSTSYAATVTLETTKCLNANIPLQQFEIEMNLSGPVARGQLATLKFFSPHTKLEQTSHQYAVSALSLLPVESMLMPFNVRHSVMSWVHSLALQSSLSPNPL